MSVDDTIKILQNEGYKITHRRKEIIYYFSKSDGYRTAKNSYNHMENISPEISYDTVYRNLHLFHDLNILESTSLNAATPLRLYCSNELHHHCICNICGKTKTLDICPMNYIGNMLDGYSIEGHKFEIYGTCPNC